MNKKENMTRHLDFFPIVIITLLLDSLFIIIDNKDPTPTRLSRPDYPDPKKNPTPLGARSIESEKVFLFRKY